MMPDTKLESLHPQDIEPYVSEVCTFVYLNRNNYILDFCTQIDILIYDVSRGFCFISE